MQKKNQSITKLSERIIPEEQNTFPNDIVLETTGFCNLRCTMCSNRKMTRKRGNMRWPLYIKIVEEIAEKAKDVVRLWLCFYGEPLMNRDIVDRVTYAKQKGINNVVINSNMNLMKPELAVDLIKAGLNTVFVGLDAVTADIYKQIRCGGDYDRVVRNVLDYKNALNEYGTSEQQVVVQFIDMPINHHQCEQIVEFWNKHDIDVKVRPYVTWQDSSIIEDSYNVGENEERVPCHWLMNIFPITSDGYAVWCGCDYDGQGICGDLNKQTIEEIWNTEKKQHRIMQIGGQWDELPEFCLKCNDWHGAYAKYEKSMQYERGALCLEN